MNGTSASSTDQISHKNLEFRANYRPQLNTRELHRIEEIRTEILRNFPALDRTLPFGPLCRQGLEDMPSLMIEDHSGIQLSVKGKADLNLSYRSLMLAGDGDLVAVYGARDREFERYCKRTLALGTAKVFAPEIADPTTTLADACRNDDALMTHAVQTAQLAGGINLVSYMATGGIWHLGSEIAQQAKVPVNIAGPQPSLTRAVNDKLWFSRWAARLLGKDAVPHARSVYGMGALVGHLRRFTKQHSAVAIKLSHSAASMGNMVFDSATFSGMSAAEMAEHLGLAIKEREWGNPFPLQVTAWEGPVLASPSAQLWIPKAKDGPPIIEGFFDQLTSGEIARFVGGVPSTLGEQIKGKMARDAAMLGALFQALGYFGRCSFDALVIGKNEQSSDLHWVECNGRWGGISIPLTLANRLAPDCQAGGFLVFSHQSDDGASIQLDQFLSLHIDLMFRAGGTSGAVLMTPSTLAHGRVELLIIAEDQASALAIAEGFASTTDNREGIRITA